jgi:hypothetical protein
LAPMAAVAMRVAMASFIAAPWVVGAAMVQPPT